MHVFDIIGPIMIGPSSSHTAGAARIGRVTRKLLGEAPISAKIGLYGSFASTARGHGTDRALIAGLLDMRVDDPRLRDSLSIAAGQGLSYTFEKIELQNAHPNTVIIEARGATVSVVVRAASVGGGAIRVEEVSGLKVNFTGSAHTLIIAHRDRPGVIAKVSGALAQVGINIATMQVSRETAGGAAVMVLEIDALPDGAALSSLRDLAGIDRVTFIKAG